MTPTRSPAGSGRRVVAQRTRAAMPRPALCVGRPGWRIVHVTRAGGGCGHPATREAAVLLPANADPPPPVPEPPPRTGHFSRRSHSQPNRPRHRTRPGCGAPLDRCQHAPATSRACACLDVGVNHRRELPRDDRGTEHAAHATADSPLHAPPKGEGVPTSAVERTPLTRGEGVGWPPCGNGQQGAAKPKNVNDAWKLTPLRRAKIDPSAGQFSSFVVILPMSRSFRR